MVIKTSLSDHAMLHGSDVNLKPERARFQGPAGAPLPSLPLRRVNPPLTGGFAFAGKAIEKAAFFGMED
jgi:hypothetical protein